MFGSGPCLRVVTTSPVPLRRCTSRTSIRLVFSVVRLETFYFLPHLAKLDSLLRQLHLEIRKQRDAHLLVELLYICSFRTPYAQIPDSPRIARKVLFYNLRPRS